MTDRTLPYLDAGAVARLTPMPALIAAIEAAFAGDAHAPPRQAHELDATSSLLVMPAWTPARHIGVKLAIIDRAADPAVKASYMLIDRTSGLPVATMDGSAITARRTAAASALAARQLARADAATHLILGTGALVPRLIEAYAAVRPIRRVLIWGRTPAKAEAAAAEARTLGHAAEAVPAIDAVLGEADIVSAATLSTAPLIRGALLKPGTHVDLIGAFRPEMCEADGACFARARIFVDTVEGAMDEAGDLLQAIAAGFVTAADIAGDLHALSGGDHPGRAGDDQAITLFKSVGSGIEDIAAAELAFAGWRAERPIA